MADDKPKVVVVLGPWSSGTSAVAGVVALLGAEAHAPFLRVADPSTPRSFESLALRGVLLDSFDHAGLRRLPLASDTTSKIRNWAGDAPLSVAKMPMLCFFLSEICAAWEPLFVVVHRSLNAIEASRLRRDWPEEYGSKGAKVIYPLIEAGIPEGARRLDVDYSELLADPAGQGARIARYCGLAENPDIVRYVLSRGRDGQAPSFPSSG
ncbi:MAG: hypothetical protein AB8B85_21880 [Paracoccaceae bacterium]